MVGVPEVVAAPGAVVDGVGDVWVAAGIQVYRRVIGVVGGRVDDLDRPCGAIVVRVHHSIGIRGGVDVGYVGVSRGVYRYRGVGP